MECNYVILVLKLIITSLNTFTEFATKTIRVNFINFQRFFFTWTRQDAITFDSMKILGHMIYQTNQQSVFFEMVPHMYGFRMICSSCKQVSYPTPIPKIAEI